MVHDTEDWKCWCIALTNRHTLTLKYEGKPDRRRVVGSLTIHLKYETLHLVPDGTRPIRSHPSFPVSPCSTARSRSRKCRPLTVQCGTAGSGHSGLCSLKMPRATAEPGNTIGFVIHTYSVVYRCLDLF